MALSKKKATASANARNRSQAEQRLAEAPKTGSDKHASQSRFPGETPLTGEDRPATRSGPKRHQSRR